MKYFSLIIIVLLLSCNIQKRCQWHLKKATELGCIKNDTFTTYDTIQRLKLDTTYIGINEVDTFTYYDSIYKVQTIVKWREKTIKLNVQSKDTIIQTKHSVKTLIKYEDKLPLSVKILLGFLGLIILFLIFKK